MEKDITILQGKTFELPIRWETTPLVYKPITGMAKSAPVRITATGHGAPDGWKIAIMSAKGMTELNAANNPPKGDDFYVSTKVDTDHIEINTVNSADFKAYVSGGYVVYYTPMSLTGATARIKIKDRIGGTVLASSEVADTPLDVLVVDVDDTLKVITLTISATDTAAMTFKKGVYELEMVSATGVVTALLTGKVTVTQEVTT